MINGVAAKFNWSNPRKMDSAVSKRAGGKYSEQVRSEKM
jgi:hypothetical protein